MCAIPCMLSSVSRHDRRLAESWDIQKGNMPTSPGAVNGGSGHCQDRAHFTSVGIAGSCVDGHLRFGVRRLDAALCGWCTTGLIGSLWLMCSTPDTDSIAKEKRRQAAALQSEMHPLQLLLRFRIFCPIHSCVGCQRSTVIRYGQGNHESRCCLAAILAIRNHDGRKCFVRPCGWFGPCDRHVASSRGWDRGIADG